MNPLRPCPHREILPGPLATPIDLEQWAHELAAETCPACQARAEAPPPVVEEELHPLPPAVDEALRQETRAGAQRAQATCDALGVTDELYPAIARRLSQQPGTSPFWRRWWATWRGGVLLAGQPA